MIFAEGDEFVTDLAESHYIPALGSRMVEPDDRIVLRVEGDGDYLGGTIFLKVNVPDAVGLIGVELRLDGLCRRDLAVIYPCECHHGLFALMLELDHAEGPV